MQINYLAVLVCAIVFMALGFFWYSPMLFAKQWMKLVKKTEKDIKKDAKPQMYIAAFVIALIISYMLANIINIYQATGAINGAITGFWVWLGFTATTTATEYLFEGRPRYLYFINTGYQLVAFIIAGGILAVWK